MVIPFCIYCRDEEAFLKAIENVESVFGHSRELFDKENVLPELEVSPKEIYTLFYRFLYKEKRPLYVGVGNSDYTPYMYTGYGPVGRVLSEDGFTLALNNLKLTLPSYKGKI